MPKTSQPRWTAERTAARMTAFRPGASPPPVLSAMRRIGRCMTSLPESGTGAARRSAERVADLLPGRVAAGALLGVDQAAVAADLEHAAGGLDELDRRVRELLLDAGFQTGSARTVVSEPAVLDPDVHGRSPPRCILTRGRPRRACAQGAWR